MDNTGKINRALLILNPNSGINPLNFIVSKDIERHKNELTCLKSLSAEYSKNMIKENLNKYDIFIAAGGDGTVGTVASALIDSKKILGVLPMGSGNGFAKEFGFSLNIKSLLTDIRRGKAVEIDVIEINDKPCLNVAGLGLDSSVAHSFNDLKIRGLLQYFILTFKTFLKFQPFHAEIRSNERVISNEQLFILAIANTRQFGNNAFIAPHARPDDGIIDLVLVKPFPKILGPLFMFRLFTKRLKESKYVKHIRTNEEIIIKTDENKFHIDGEPVEISEDVVVRIKKKALNVLVTKRNKFSRN